MFAVRAFVTRAMANNPDSKRESTDATPLAAEATIELLELVKHGDDAALDRLLQRCIPALRRWARGRLPQSARGMLETTDLVQDAVMAAMRHLNALDVRHQGALQAYLHQAVKNRIIDIVRQQQRRPQQAEMPEHMVDERTGPLERAIGIENMERYDRAVQRLRMSDREAIVLRLELQYEYEEMAVLLDKPSAAAARVAVTRAMKRLAEEMGHAT